MPASIAAVEALLALRINALRSHVDKALDACDPDLAQEVSEEFRAARYDFEHNYSSMHIGSMLPRAAGVQATYPGANRPRRPAQYVGCGAGASLLRAGLERVFPVGANSEDTAKTRRMTAPQAATYLAQQWKRGTTMYRELLKRGAWPSTAKLVAANSCGWWHNSDRSLKVVMTISYFDGLGGTPRDSTSTTRIARCGPACRMVWQVSGP